MGIIKQEIYSETLKKRFRKEKKYFTRQRIFTFPLILIFMSNMLKRSLSIEILDFLSSINNEETKVKSFTKSAFIQQRKKIKPEVFKHLSNTIVKEFYTDNDLSIKLWKKYRILAVDGSIITLPNTKELAEKYGTQTNHTETKIVQARASVLYDVLNKVAIDSVLTSLQIGERKTAKKLLSSANSNDIIIYDRGYPSFELLHKHLKEGIPFLMRLKSDYNNVVKTFIKSGKTNEIVQMKPNKNDKFQIKEYEKETIIKVRLIRVKLQYGKEEILITSLLNSKKITTKNFKELYFKRWGIETYYDELKNKLKLENFSGYSSDTIQQDFNIAIFISNIQSLVVNEINEEIKIETKGRKLKYKVNTNISYGIIKNRIIHLFTDDNVDITNEMKRLFKENLTPIRPHRKNKRNVRKYMSRRKPKLVKNLKNAI